MPQGKNIAANGSLQYHFCSLKKKAGRTLLYEVSPYLELLLFVLTYYEYEINFAIIVQNNNDFIF
ncbi:MAG: hypothetical protein IJO95_02165, partial [Clostridia bacterium]|nr:hypothetical protein [Clostridia bacterium]